MAVTVNRIDLGFDQCYLLKAEGAVLVDAGAPNRRKEFLDGLKKAAIEAHEVKLVVITHGHWDHIGSAGEIRSITGAKLAMHFRDAVWLEGSQKHLSPGVSPC